MNNENKKKNRNNFVGISKSLERTSEMSQLRLHKEAKRARGLGRRVQPEPLQHAPSRIYIPSSSCTVASRCWCVQERVLFTARITRDLKRQAGLITVTDTAVLNWQRVTYLLMASNVAMRHVGEFHIVDSQD